jgi:hypothetical protein
MRAAMSSAFHQFAACKAWACDVVVTRRGEDVPFGAALNKNASHWQSLGLGKLGL